jgi:hypothetical protein
VPPVPHDFPRSTLSVRAELIQQSAQRTNLLVGLGKTFVGIRALVLAAVGWISAMPNRKTLGIGSSGEKIISSSGSDALPFCRHWLCCFSCSVADAQHYLS